MPVAGIGDIIGDATRRGRRVQRHPAGARGGDRRGRGGGRGARRPADQRELRALPRRAGPDRAGLRSPWPARRRGAGGRPSRPRHRPGTGRGGGGAGRRLGDVRRLGAARRGRMWPSRPRSPPGATSAASGWRPSWARWAARTACTRPAPAPIRTRRPSTWRATGVDALAVAVGTSHAMTTRDAVLDLVLIAELRAAVPVPLVLHGSSGVPDDTLREAVRHGMKKINIATHLNKVFTGADPRPPGRGRQGGRLPQVSRARP